MARVPKGGARALDPAYGPALAAANRFLHAWQTQDHETGIMMLTDSARQHASREQLQEFFSSGANEAGFVFPVVLFDTASSPHPHFCRIIIVKAGKDEWAVDKLP